MILKRFGKTCWIIWNRLIMLPRKGMKIGCWISSSFVLNILISFWKIVRLRMIMRRDYQGLSRISIICLWKWWWRWEGTMKKPRTISRVSWRRRSWMIGSGWSMNSLRILTRSIGRWRLSILLIWRHFRTCRSRMCCSSRRCRNIRINRSSTKNMNR